MKWITDILGISKVTFVAEQDPPKSDKEILSDIKALASGEFYKDRNNVLANRVLACLRRNNI